MLGRQGKERKRKSIATIMGLEQIRSAKILAWKQTPNQPVVPVSFVLLWLN